MKSFHSVSWLNRMLLLIGGIVFNYWLVTAAIAQSVDVKVDSANGPQGATVQTPVSLSNIPTGDQTGIVGIKLIIRYDPAVVRAPMRFVDEKPVTDCAELADPLKNDWSLEQNALLSNPSDLTSQTGTLKIALANDTPLAGDGEMEILKLTWELVGAPDACSPITVTEIHLLPPTGEGDEYPADPIVNGKVCITSEVIISDVKVSNHQNGEATITWCTDIPSNSIVNYGPTPDRGVIATGNDNVTLHQVTLTGLTAETRYYFCVQSGNTIDDNGGNLYPFTTTKVGGINPFHTVYGFVYKDDAKTQPAVGALVCLTVTNNTGTSHPLSTLTGNSGEWVSDLTNLKNPATNDNFSYAVGDVMHVEANCCADGTARVDVPVTAEASQRIPDMICTRIEEYTFSLKAGLNSIGFPIQLIDSYTCHSLLLAIPDAVKIYNLRPGSGFELCFKIPNTDPPLITGPDFPILPDRGYIVEVEQDSQFTVRGYPYSAPLPLDLKAGLNMCVILCTPGAYTCHSLLLAIPDAVKIYNLRPGSGFELCFKIPNTDPPLITGPDFPILPDRGYIVEVEQDTTFTPACEPPASPAIVLFPARSTEALPEQIQTPPQMSDIHAHAATISWLGSIQSLRYGTSPYRLERVVYDAGVSHLVHLEGLQPGMTYFYAVGDQIGHFQTLSKESLSFTFHTLAGEIRRPDGSVAPDGTLVYVQVGESRLVSQTTSGMWSVDLVNLPDGWQVGQQAVIEAYSTGYGKLTVQLSASDTQWVSPLRLKAVSDVAPVGETGRFSLFSNYPNPFNPETWIPFELARDAEVTLSIYDVQGRLVRMLNLGHRPAGLYASPAQAAYWDGRNEHGESVATGIYFYTLRAGGDTATRRMLLLK